MLIVFWDMKGPVTIDFFEKVATVKSYFYCKILGQNVPYLLSDSCIFADWAVYNCCFQGNKEVKILSALSAWAVEYIDSLSAVE